MEKLKKFAGRGASKETKWLLLFTMMLWPGWSQTKLTLLLWLREIWPG
jgi:hypothetical protein